MGSQQQINIAMRKVTVVLNADSFKSVKFRETVKSVVASDHAFSFMNTIKGTQVYWKRFKSEVLAMVKQLGIPTFILTLSCAGLRWNEILTIIRKLNEADFDISSLSHHDRCKILNENPLMKKLYDSIKADQICQHLKPCHKYKNKKCRFLFGRYIADHSIIARPLETTISCAKKKKY